MNKSIFLATIIGGLVTGGMILIANFPFRLMTVNQMRHHIEEKQYQAIEKAKAQGDYKCCYDPGCTMCFMNENEWNNQQVGHCDCADLIAQGKQPCPQCIQALKQEDSGTCNVELQDCD